VLLHFLLDEKGGAAGSETASDTFITASEDVTYCSSRALSI